MNLVGFEEVNVKTEDNRLKVIDPNTNETVNYINKGDKIVRKTSINAFKELKKVETKDTCVNWNIKEFYKTNTEEMQLIIKELSQSEKAFLFSITSYVSFDDNLLQIGKGKHAVDIGTEDLIDITGMSRSTLYATIESLASKDIIYRGKNSRNKQYFVNPWLFCKGNRINKVLKTMFKNYKIRCKDNVEWKDLNDGI